MQNYAVKSMRIAIQGEAGSFSHEAARLLHPDAVVVPCGLSAEVFEVLLNGRVDAAVIPIENSLAGGVAEHYDLLLTSHVGIERESLLRIRHNLIGVPSPGGPGGGALKSAERIAALRRVYSHPVALAQCRRFFDRNPHLRAVPAYDTAGSVKRLMEASELQVDEAAIASLLAAEEYGGEVLLVDIEDNPENFTRFFLIRRREEFQVVSGADKVSIAFTVENCSGSLVAALGVFAELGTNLTRIESRPVPGQPWHYNFFADYQVATAAQADAALELLRRHCSMVKELGRYRAAGLLE